MKFYQITVTIRPKDSPHGTEYQSIEWSQPGQSLGSVRQYVIDTVAATDCEWGRLNVEWNR